MQCARLCLRSAVRPVDSGRLTKVRTTTPKHNSRYYGNGTGQWSGWQRCVRVRDQFKIRLASIPAGSSLPTGNMSRILKAPQFARHTSLSSFQTNGQINVLPLERALAGQLAARGCLELAGACSNWNPNTTRRILLCVLWPRRTLLHPNVCTIADNPRAALRRGTVKLHV